MNININTNNYDKIMAEITPAYEPMVYRQFALAQDTKVFTANLNNWYSENAVYIELLYRKLQNSWLVKGFPIRSFDDFRQLAYSVREYHKIIDHQVESEIESLEREMNNA